MIQHLLTLIPDFSKVVEHIIQWFHIFGFNIGMFDEVHLLRGLQQPYYFSFWTSVRVLY